VCTIDKKNRTGGHHRCQGIRMGEGWVMMMEKISVLKIHVQFLLFSLFFILATVFGCGFGHSFGQ